METGYKSALTERANGVGNAPRQKPFLAEHADSLENHEQLLSNVLSQSDIALEKASTLLRHFTGEPSPVSTTGDKKPGVLKPVSSSHVDALKNGVGECNFLANQIAGTIQGLDNILQQLANFI